MLAFNSICNTSVPSDISKAGAVAAPPAENPLLEAPHNPSCWDTLLQF